MLFIVFSYILVVSRILLKLADVVKIELSFVCSHGVQADTSVLNLPVDKMDYFVPG